jgi:hypothetical protein
MTGALFVAAALLAAPPARRFPAAAGLWKITSTFAMRGLPFAPPPRVVERCAPPAGDAKEWLGAAGFRENACAVDGWEGDGARVRWTARCRGRYHGRAAGELSFDGDRAAGNLTIEVEDGRGASHPVAYRIDARREGSCPP